MYQKLNERFFQAIKDCDCNKHAKVVDKQACHPYEQFKTYFSFAWSNHENLRGKLAEVFRFK